MNTYEEIWSKPKDSRKNTPLIVSLHGYGANEADLVPLFSQLPEHITYVSLRAPIALNTGYTWFPLEPDLSFCTTDIQKTTKQLVQWIENIATSHTKIGLLGFSMGMALATSALQHSPELFSCIVGLSGFITDTQDIPTTKTSHKIPYFWGRDQKDPIISSEITAIATKWLQKNTQLTKILYDNMGHNICDNEIKHIKEFLNIYLK